MTEPEERGASGERTKPPGARREKSATAEFFTGSGLPTLLIFVLIAGVLLVILTRADFASTPFLLPALLILLAVPVFVLVFVHAANVFAEEEIADASAPFGLPPGSMRAFLTAAIVVLVGVIVVFLVQSAQSRDGLRPITGIPDCVTDGEAGRLSTLRSDDFVVVLGAPRPIAKNPQQTCVPVTMLARTSNTVADDISKQAVSALLTLLASVVSFYFGTRTGEGEKSTAVGKAARDRAIGEVTSADQDAKPLVEAVDRKIAAGTLAENQKTRYAAAKDALAQAVKTAADANATQDQLTSAAQAARQAVATLTELAG